MGKYLGSRAESVRAQLDGGLASTLEGQKADPTGLIETENLDMTALSDFTSLMTLPGESLIPDILQVLLQGQFDHTTKGAVAAVHHYLEHPGALIGRIPALLGIASLRQLLLQKLAPVLIAVPLLLVLLMLILFRRSRMSKRYGKRPISVPVQDDPFFA